MGPLKIGSYEEGRSWQLAIDDVLNVWPNGQTGDNTTEVLTEITSDNASCTPTTQGIVTASDGCYTVIKSAILTMSSFNTSGITAGSTVTAAVLHIQYGAEAGYTGTNYVRYNNGGGLTNTTIQPTNNGGWSADLPYDLHAQGVDTLAEIGAVDIEFTNNDTGGSDAINFDYIYITVTYTLPTIIVSGTVYMSDETTTANTANGGPCDGSTAVVSVRVDGGTATTGSCSNTVGTYGNFSISINRTGVGATVTVYLTSTMKANIVVVSAGGAPDISSLPLIENTVVLRNDHDGVSAIADTWDYDATANNTDMLFDAVDAATDTFTTESGIELHMYTGDTFSPSGLVTTTTSTGADLHLDDSSNIYITSPGGNSIGGDVIVDAGATLSLQANTTIYGGDFTVTGTLSASGGTPIITMAGSGTIGGGGSIAFHDLVVATGVTTTIGSSVTVSGGDLTTTTTGVVTYSGTPTVLVTGSGNLGAGAGGSITFYNLSLGNGSTTATTTLTSVITTKSSLTVNTNHTFAMGTNDMSVGDTTVAGSGDISINGATSQSASGTFTILSSNGGVAELSGNGTLSVYNLTLGNGSASITVDDENSDLQVTVANDFQVTAGATYSASSTAAKLLSVGNAFTVSATGVFTPNQGIVKMTGTDGTGNVITLGSANSSFYDLTFDGSGGTFSFAAEAVTVSHNFTITNGDVTAPASQTMYVGGNFSKAAAGTSFIPNSGTVDFNGAAGTTQQISGDLLDFNNITATASTGHRTLQFHETDHFSILNATLTGSSCDSLLIIRSSSLLGEQFIIEVGGTSNITYADIKDSNASIALSASNSVNSGNNTNWTIAASPCKGTSTSSAATGYSFQRKTFYDAQNSRYWMFAYGGTGIVIKFSSDGTNWTGINGLNYNTNDFSVWNATISSTGYVWLAVKNSDDIKVLRGTLSVSDISWDDDIDVALDGTGAADTYSYPYISADSSNYLWVGARHLSGSNYAYKAVKSENAGDTDFGTLTWGTAAKLSADKMDENIYGNIVPLSSGDMYAAFVSGTELQGCRWDADNSPSAQWEDSSGSLCIANTGYSNAVIDTSTVNTATKQAPQGKTFLDSVNSRYWSFYYNGSAIEYSYSQNGSSWTSSATQSYNTADFSVFYKNISGTGYVFLVTKCNDYDICLKRGQLGSSSITNWTSEITVYDGTGTADTYSKPVVSVSADNYVFVAARKEVTTSDGNKFFKAIVNKSVNTATNDLSSWGTAAGFEIPSGNSGDIALLSQTGANMVLISGNNSNHISAWKYNGTSWVNTGSVYDFFNFENTSFNGVVYAITISGGYVYFGGNFTLAGGLAANYIVRYNITSAVYEALGNASTKGVNALVYALVVDASNNYLYVGGNFTSAYASPSNLAVSYVTRISTTSASNTFETLGNGTSKGVSGTVNALALDTVNNYLYIGGGFTMARASPSDLTVYNITRISTTSASNTFEALGNGATNGVTGGVVNALALDTANNYLYIGGGFTTAYASPLDITANRIVRISTTSASNTFEALGNGATKGLNNAVDALVLDSTNNYLYIGGYFSQAYASPSDLTVNNIARISTTSAGNTFEAMGNGGTKGVNSYIHELVLDSTNNYLYIVGEFVTAYASPSNLTVNYITRISTTGAGNTFEALGNGGTKGVSGGLFALDLDRTNNYLYFGGGFTTAYASPSNLTASNVSRISTTGADTTFELLTSGVKGVNNVVRAIVLDSINNYLYIGGDFTTAYASPTNLTVNRVARINMNSASSTFEALGNSSTKGVVGAVNALALDTTNNYLYIGGAFTTANASPSNLTVNYITRISTTSAGNTFEAMGNGTSKGVNGVVSALALDITNNYLYLGGNFVTAYAAPDLVVNYITRISTTSASNTFEALGNSTTFGVNGGVYALALDTTNNYLYLGGVFTSAYASPLNLTVNRIARISTTSAGSTFEALGNGGNKGVNNYVYALALDTTNNYLYLGGDFTQAYASPSDLTVNYIARISTTSAGNTFEALGNGGTKGVSGGVRALAVDSTNNYLYIGGTFATAYASPSDLTVNNIARISTTSAGNTFETLGNGITKGADNTVRAFFMDNTNRSLYLGGSYISTVGRAANYLSIYAKSVTVYVGISAKISAAADSSGNIHLLYTKSEDNDLYYKKFDASGGTWGSEVSVYTGTVSTASLLLDSDNNDVYAIFIDSNTVYFKKAVSPHASGDWDNSATTITSTGTNIYLSGCQPASSTCFQLTSGSSNPYDVKFYYYEDIMVADAIDTVPSGIENSLSAVADGSGNVHLLYVDADPDDSLPDSTDQVSYKKWNGTSWGAATLVANAADDNDAYPSLSLDTADSTLYALWIDSSTSHIYYSSCSVSSSCDDAAEWANETDWKTTGTNTYVTSNYSGEGMVFAEWTTGSAGSYTVNWDSIIAVPENILLLLVVAPLLPKIGKRKWYSRRGVGKLLKYLLDKIRNSKVKI